MSLSFDTLAAANKYTDDSLAGAGAVAGVPCQIQSITEITGGHRVTFLWLDNNGDSHTSTMDVMDGAKGDPGEKGDTGLGIKSMAINAQAHLIITYDNDSTEDAGEVPNVQADWNETVEAADSFIKNKPTLGSAAAKNYTTNVRPGNHDLVESNAVFAAIDSALTSVYTPHGDLTCAELTADLLIASNVGNVYTMTDSGTTSALFVNGAGITISANDSVGIIRAGADSIMFNYMGNVLDLHEYQKKELTTPLTIGGQSQDEVEGALGALNTAKQDKTLATPIKIGGDNQTSVEGALGALNTAKVDWDDYSVLGAVNILENKGSTKTLQGVKFTIQSDKSIILKRESTGINTSDYVINSFTIKKGKYRLKGTGTSDVTFQVTDDPVTQALYNAGVNDVVMTFNSDTAIKVRVSIYSNKDYDNVQIYPMIVPIAYKGDYQPYAMTNQELTKVDVANVNILVQTAELAQYRVRKCGKIVECTISLQVNEAVTAWTDFATIPEGFRPSTYIQAVNNKTMYAGFAVLQIAPNGGIQSAVNLAVGDRVRFTTVWICP